MCGLVAILSRDGPAQPARLVRALDLMQPRGPDASGQIARWDDTLLLGHRLLSIMDGEQASQQPMLDPETGTALIFNGTIYNFQELRQELQAIGCRFRTTGDTEVLLAAWKHWGEAAFARFNGMWGVVIHDPQRDRLIVSRDRLGVKPLYLRDDGQTIVLGSTVGAVLIAANAQAEPDDAAIFEYLFSGSSSFAGRSFFSGIVPVPPGACWSIRRDGSITTGRFHDWADAEVERPISMEALRSVILDAVRIRLHSAVPTGILLSGGLDSSIIAWAAGKLASAGHAPPPHFFSYGYTDSNENDETEAAAMMACAAGAGTQHKVLRVSALPDATDVDHLLAAQEEPVSTLSAIATHRLYRHMHHQGFRVALTGEGSDELFAGYTRRYLPMLIRDKIKHGKLADAAPLLASPVLDKFSLLRRLVWELPPALLTVLLARSSAAAVIAPALRHQMHHLLDAEIQRRRYPLKTALVDDVQRGLLPRIMRYADRNGMASSLEVRCPFLDHRLVALALALPVEAKLWHAGGKRILRDAFAGILPARVTQTPKRLGMGHAEQFNSAALSLMPLLETPPPQAERYLNLPKLRHRLKSSPQDPTLWWSVNLLMFLHSMQQRNMILASAAHD